MAGIPFHRYVYGKIVGIISEPVEAGFEHKITCVTRGFPDASLKFCDPTHRIDATRLRSTCMLVHPAVQRQGTFFLLPVRAGDRTYMSASRLRVRSKAGETKSEITPGRTYTQYDLYLFRAVVWAEHAPWLLPTIPGWLRTDPTLRLDFERGREIPEERLPAGPDRFPFHQDTALPGADSQVWSMLDALESIETLGVFEPATSLPPRKGILFRARTGHCPAAAASACLRDGCRQRLRGPARLCDPTPEGVRHRLARVLTALGEEKSLDALEDYLTGRARHPPCELTREKTKAKWLVRLDDYLRQIAQGRLIAGIAQGKPVAEFPERAVELTAALTSAEWAAAWRHAFRQVGSAQGRRLLAWSALRSDTEGDGVVDGFLSAGCQISNP